MRIAYYVRRQRVGGRWRYRDTRTGRWVSADFARRSRAAQRAAAVRKARIAEGVERPLPRWPREFFAPSPTQPMDFEAEEIVLPSPVHVEVEAAGLPAIVPDSIEDAPWGGGWRVARFDAGFDWHGLGDFVAEAIRALGDPMKVLVRVRVGEEWVAIRGVTDPESAVAYAHEALDYFERNPSRRRLKEIELEDYDYLEEEIAEVEIVYHD